MFERSTPNASGVQLAGGIPPGEPLPAPVRDLVPAGVADNPGLYVAAGVCVLAYRHRGALLAVVRRVLGFFRAAR